MLDALFLPGSGQVLGEQMEEYMKQPYVDMTADAALFLMYWDYLLTRAIHEDTQPVPTIDVYRARFTEHHRQLVVCELEQMGAYLQ